MNVYDKASVEDIRAGLRVASKKLLGGDLLPTTPKQPEKGRECGLSPVLAMKDGERGRNRIRMTT